MTKSKEIKKPLMDKVISFDEGLMVELFRDLDTVFLSYGLSEMERYWVALMYTGEKQSYVTMKVYNSINYGVKDLYVPKKEHVQ